MNKNLQFPRSDCFLEKGSATCFKCRIVLQRLQYRQKITVCSMIMFRAQILVITVETEFPHVDTIVELQESLAYNQHRMGNRHTDVATYA
jgi:hypothetical protein